MVGLYQSVGGFQHETITGNHDEEMADLMLGQEKTFQDGLFNVCLYVLGYK